MPDPEPPAQASRDATKHRHPNTGVSHMAEQDHAAAPLAEQAGWIAATQQWVTYAKISEQAFTKFVASLANTQFSAATAARVVPFAAWLAAATNTATLQAVSCWAVVTAYAPDTSLPGAVVKSVNELIALQRKLGLVAAERNLSYDTAVQAAGHLYPLPPPPPLLSAPAGDSYAPGGAK